MPREEQASSRKIYWIVTENCNLGCTYCYYNTGLEARVRAPQSTIEQKIELINQFPSFFDETVFTGGEALIHPDIYTLIEASKQRNLRVDLLTNGVLLTPENCQKLVDRQVDCVSVSLDSLDLVVNDEVRGKGARVRQGIENLLGVRSSSMAMEIMMTVTRKNLGSIRPMVDFCKARDINLWLDPVEINPNISRLEPLDLMKMTDVERQKFKEEFEYWVAQMGNSSLGAYAQSCLQVVSGQPVAGLTCGMGTDHFVVDVDGVLYPCFSRKDVALGNVYTDGLQQVLESSALGGEQSQLQAAVCVSLGCICMTMVTDYDPNNGKH